MFVARPSNLDADVIVIGAGLGGSAAAWQLAQHGLSVLVLEAGPGEAYIAPPRGNRQKVIERLRPILRGTGSADPQFISYFIRDRADGKHSHPSMIRHGRGPGGSSALYSAALGRMKRSDFVNSRASGSADPALPNAWPIDYDSFKAYYLRAEALMRVRGERDPGDSSDDAELLPPPGLSPDAQAVRDALEANGLRPFRLHVAIEYVAGCTECCGSRCGLDCKSNGYNRGLKLAVAEGSVQLETDTTVLTIAVEPDAVRVDLRDAGGLPVERRARRVVLAAGALNSPLILARSADLWRLVPPPPMLGRGLMFHVSELFVLATRKAAGATPRKWLGLRDFYDDGSVDVGEIQSVGTDVGTGTVMEYVRERAARVAGGRLLPLAELLRPAAWIAARAIGARPVFATITEDLPHASNRVSEEDGRIVVTYHTDSGLKERARRMRARLRAAFAPLPVRFLVPAGRPNWGHPMGTCRMGTDPATSVTTPEGQLRGHEQIFVADASAFPSSGGTGPGLTVLAHALRVADRVAAEIAPSTAPAAGQAAL